MPKALDLILGIDAEEVARRLAERTAKLAKVRKVRLQAKLATLKLEIVTEQAQIVKERRELAERIRASLQESLPVQAAVVLSHNHLCTACNRTGTCKEDCGFAFDVTRYHKCAPNLARIDRFLFPDERPLGCKCDVKPCLHRPRTGQESTRIVVCAGGLQIGN